ncbi:Basic 7S globulin 2 small subunit [Heracleum sosnowskyi]|uniref:Basic 7S globulin 2 small subunit n=1 Tax=Heracleum sosnowskyi TaxID=360622 RepID=A0AAD8MXW8_9APIA|nr:Basic 7S globulin 2 small subunit [Heracleum sosnowskyi]
MISNFFFILVAIFSIHQIHFVHSHVNASGSIFSGIEMPQHSSFAAEVSSTSACNPSASTTSEQDGMTKNPAVKLHLKHGSTHQKTKGKESVKESTYRDLIRIQTLDTRITQNKNQNLLSRLVKEGVSKHDEIKNVLAPGPESFPGEYSDQLMAKVESGVSLGSGEYFMDVFIGTPPKHYSLILDTGSDLNWVQSVPCYDCFEQNGPYYNPKDSKSFRDINCHDPRCQLVSSPDPPQPCKDENQTCPYFYWYGDSSNTTGDFALETFTINLTTHTGKSEFRQLENVMFGSGHWNRGLFHGASGLLGLGRGPLSFSSQLQSSYGHSFSYCLVDRNSDPSVSSKLIFGEDKDLLGHKELNFTSFVSGKDNPVDTFYYIQIKSIIVGGEVLNIPQETWKLSSQGVGGTIIDSGVKDIALPTFAIEFVDGAIWNFPTENYFIRLEPEEIVCLAMLENSRSRMSILGNYQQQNFHISYDTKRSRLGFAPANCANL